MTRSPSSTATNATASRTAGPPPAPRHHGLLLRFAALTFTLLMATALVGCSSDEDSTSSTTSASTTSSATTYPADKQEVCQARDELESSVKALTNPALLREGATGIKDAVSQVQTDLQALRTAAKEDYQPQIAALQASIEDLQAAADKLGSGNVAQNMGAVGTAIASVRTDASALLTQLKTTCGS